MKTLGGIPKKRQYLKFSNPVFHEGLNLTTRRGIKWATVKGRVDIGDLQTAEIKFVKVVRFKDVSPEDLKHEHDPSCRTYEGLYNEMRRVYDLFDENEVVTLIFFEPTK